MLPGILIAEIESAAAYAKAARASSTQRVYASDWRIFVAWCAGRSVEALPADSRAVATFLAVEADKGSRPATIGRRLAAIGYYHKQARMQPPQASEGARLNPPGRYAPQIGRRADLLLILKAAVHSARRCLRDEVAAGPPLGGDPV